MRARFEDMIMQVQARFCRELEACDPSGGTKFTVDKWDRTNHGGGGITCFVEDSPIFDKAGVNISVVHGTLPPSAVKQMRARGHDEIGEGPQKFFAAGISSVIHPKNPHAPTVHFNYR